MGEEPLPTSRTVVVLKVEVGSIGVPGPPKGGWAGAAKQHLRKHFRAK